MAPTAEPTDLFDLANASMPDHYVIVHNTMGAAYIGVVCASCLYGVSCVQTWFYLNRYHKASMFHLGLGPSSELKETQDPWYLKLLVSVVWLFDSIHQALVAHTVYFYVITNFSNPAMLANLVWSILLEVLFNGLIGLLVQSFLTIRVWRLSKHNLPLSIVTAGLVMAEFVCSAVFTVQSMKLVTWADLSGLKGLSNTINVLGVVSDVAIAGGLFYYLHNSRTGFKRSDTMISKLILFSVSTGLLTSVCAVASLVSNLVWGNTLIYVTFYFCLGRLYSNSLLATLNARNRIRGETEENESSSFSLQTFPIPRARNHKIPNAPNTNITIKIDTTHELVRDTDKEDKAERLGANASIVEDPIKEADETV